MAVRDDFAAGEVLAAADLNDTFASKVDYALPTNAQTGTAYTFVAADAEKLTTASNGSAVTLTIPPASSVAWPDETILRVVNYGAGAVTIAGGSGVTVTNTSSTVAQYGAAVAIRTGSDAWTVVPFGGGDVPPATVSSPAATGQYTDTGITYDYYTFTASGTLTVDTAGFADVLVVGAGGGGGNDSSGGAGGFIYDTQVYLEATTHTVTIGAGGVGSSSPSATAGLGSGSSLPPLYAAGGGHGGTINQQGGPGASSGGGGRNVVAGKVIGGGLGNTGGDGTGSYGGTGGGSAGAGVTGAAANATGGAGTSNSITGSAVFYAAGGNGSKGTPSTAEGQTPYNNSGPANSGDGAGAYNGTGNGGSGVVIVRVAV